MRAAPLMALAPIIAFAVACADGSKLTTADGTGAAWGERAAAAVQVGPSPASVAVGDTLRLTALALATTGSVIGGKTGVWRSSDSAVAAVSPDGLLRGVATGTATVSATIDGARGTSAVTVTAARAGSPRPPDSAASPDCDLVTDALWHDEPTLAKPGYLQSYVDPVFHVKVTRIGGDPDATIPVVAGRWGELARHRYSKDQPWNADQSLILLDKVSGVSGYLFLDGATYEPVFRRSPAGNETRWHPRLAGVMVYLKKGSCEVGHWDVRANSAAPIMRLAGYVDCQIGPYEGNLSRDGSWIGVNGKRTADGHAVGFAVDLANRRKYPDIDLAARGISYLGWISVSPGARYLVVEGTIDGHADATQLFDLQGAPVGSPWSEYGRPSHYDLSVDANGDEVAVGVSKSAPDNGRVIMRRLRDGLVTALTPGGYASHTSTRNAGRPGWAYVSHTTSDAKYAPFNDEVFAVKLDGSMRIERLAQLHTSRVDYDSEAQAVPSPDGRRVMFASNWKSGTGRPVQAYVVDTRPLCR